MKKLFFTLVSMVITLSAQAQTDVGTTTSNTNVTGSAVNVTAAAGYINLNAANAVIVSYAFWYLVGSFISVSWLPADWAWSLRVVMSATATVWGVALWLRLNHEAAVDH